jgi:hypothetical protein
VKRTTPTGLQELGALVRHRFTAADGIVYSHDEHDTPLWQIVAGHDVIWDALPAVTHQIPEWHQLGDAVTLLAPIAAALGTQGDLLILRLP